MFRACKKGAKKLFKSIVIFHSLKMKLRSSKFKYSTIHGKKKKQKPVQRTASKNSLRLTRYNVIKFNYADRYALSRASNDITFSMSKYEKYINGNVIV